MSANPDGPGHDEMTFAGEPLSDSPWTDAFVEPPPPAPAPPAPAPARKAPAREPSGAVGQLRDQIVAAHRAALQAQNAIVDGVIGQGPSIRPPAPPREPATQLAYDVVAPGHAALLDAVLSERLWADDQRGHRFLEGVLTYHGLLPTEAETVRCEAEIDQAQGAVSFHAACRSGDRPVLELTGGRAGPAEERPDAAGPDRVRPGRVSRFKPLARTEKTRLDAADIAALAAGRFAEAFGEGHRQDGCNPSLRLPGEPLRMIDQVDVDRRGGGHGLGRLVALKDLHAPPLAVEPLIIDGAGQLLQTYLLSLGAHLVLPDALFQPMAGLATRVTVTGRIPAGIPSLRYEAEVVELGLLDRPHVVADVTVFDGERPIMSIRELGMRIVEKPGTPYRPGPGGRVEAFLGRTNSLGERALLNELHMAHAAKGDLAVAMGPEFAIYENSRAPYIPNGDFLFVDRMMGWKGERGKPAAGATMVTEYDSPGDSWYYEDNGHPFLPHAVLMETSLQSAVLLGYYLGATLPYPDEQFSIRNLDGHATVVKDLDLRGKTIRQRSKLLSQNAMTGAILQNFSYELSADGETFYTGESLFGYFSEEALATQIGLDAGRYVPPWQDVSGSAGSGATRRIDLREDAQRARLTGGPGLRLGSGQLQLVDWVDLVPGGGEHQAGYLRGYRKVTPDEWYYSCHFHRDPVMPGSLGVEAIVQAMQLYVIETGLAADMDGPRFALPAGVELSWRYRGQILRTDGDMDFDVHIKEVRQEPGRIVVIGDANLWKPGLRIYELKNLAIAVVPS